MPSMTITTDAANTTKLQAVVDFYNARNGTTLTLKQWSMLMLREAYKSWNNERVQSTVAMNEEVTLS